MVRVAEKVNSASEGGFVMKVQPAGAVVPATKEFDGVDRGVVDCAQTSYMYWLDKFPAAGL